MAFYQIVFQTSLYGLFQKNFFQLKILIFRIYLENAVMVDNLICYYLTIFCYICFEFLSFFPSSEICGFSYFPNIAFI